MRAFIKESGLFAIGISVFGKVRWNNGQTSTTTDILGPYYRPGAPFRTAKQSTKASLNLAE